MMLTTTAMLWNAFLNFKNKGERDMKSILELTFMIMTEKVFIKLD